MTDAGTGSGPVTSSPAASPAGDLLGPVHGAGERDAHRDADGGSTFTGWSGACTGTGTCAVAMTAARNVTATFALRRRLTVTVAPGGNGDVVSNPFGINCPQGETCSALFPEGTVVQLSQDGDSNSDFAGWGGACSGLTATCSVMMNADTTVSAAFRLDAVGLPQRQRNRDELAGGDRLRRGLRRALRPRHEHPADRRPRLRPGVHRLERRGLQRHRGVHGPVPSSSTRTSPPRSPFPCNVP